MSNPFFNNDDRNTLFARLSAIALGYSAVVYAVTAWIMGRWLSV